MLSLIKFHVTDLGPLFFLLKLIFFFFSIWFSSRFFFSLIVSYPILLFWVFLYWVMWAWCMSFKLFLIFWLVGSIPTLISLFKDPKSENFPCLYFSPDVFLKLIFFQLLKNNFIANFTACSFPILAFSIFLTFSLGFGLDFPNRGIM